MAATVEEYSAVSRVNKEQLPIPDLRNVIAVQSLAAAGNTATLNARTQYVSVVSDADGAIEVTNEHGTIQVPIAAGERRDFGVPGGVVLTLR